jgi:hypothetical protein
MAMARVAILGLGALASALMRQIAGMKGSGIGVIGVADSTSGLAMLRTPLSSDEVSHALLLFNYTLYRNKHALFLFIICFVYKQKEALT